MIKRILFLLVLIALISAACGSSQPAATSAPVGNAANGKVLFNEPTIGSANAPGCATCHSLEPGKTLAGPSLAGIATEAAGAFKESGYKGSAKSAAEWLREDIVNPDVEIMEGFQPGTMYQKYGNDLSDQQLNDLVAYLLTLK